jgi:hypothetical protein
MVNSAIRIRICAYLIRIHPYSEVLTYSTVQIKLQRIPESQTLAGGAMNPFAQFKIQTEEGSRKLVR